MENWNNICLEKISQWLQKIKSYILKCTSPYRVLNSIIFTQMILDYFELNKTLIIKVGAERKGQHAMWAP